MTDLLNLLRSKVNVAQDNLAPRLNTHYDNLVQYNPCMYYNNMDYIGVNDIFMVRLLLLVFSPDTVFRKLWEIMSLSQNETGKV